mgnify:CR=1 FL=1
MNNFFIFPVHLFKETKNLLNKNIYLIEDPIYFTMYKYHKLKLAYHRATMKYYYDYLKKKKINVKYVEFKEANNSFYQKFKNKNVETYESYDNFLNKKLKKNILNLKFLDSLNFLVNKKFLDENKDEFYKNGSYNHNGFYKMQRIRFDILMNKDGTPKGGKWSYDTENREKIPDNLKIPEIYKVKYNKNKYVLESINYINKNFKNNYGNLDNFIYPINHNDALNWLKHFCKVKFKLFGIYEDAETMKDPFLFHSVLTPMMNIGILTDKEVLKEIIKYENKVPINSYEGFIRQIIGWRNYDLTIYLYESEKIRKMNFLKHKNKINDKIMWSANINIKPFDNVIDKINNYAYAHHIERLMYLGNFCLLLQIHPKDVFKAFMSWTIDAYDWVMIGNVYCMSQYADGGIMMNKPYFSSSNYILNMSDYKREDWCLVWDALYYNFINTHQDILRKNYSWARHVSFWNKKPVSERKIILKRASDFIKITIKKN